MPPVTDDRLKTLNPYTDLGVRLEVRGAQAIGDCPFCGKEGKFSVEVETGKYKCWKCLDGNENGGGNGVVFLQKVMEYSALRTTDDDRRELTTDRGLLRAETVKQWGLVKSIVNGMWLLAGYSPGGALTQVYRYLTDRTGRRALWPVKGLPHRIHGIPLWDDGKDTVYVCEGVWDALAMWEALRYSKQSGGGLSMTQSANASLLVNANVIAVPSCGAVGKPLEAYLPMFAGKRVALLFDNDYPRAAGPSGKAAEGAGPAATKRLAKMLYLAPNPPREILCYQWGPDGHAPDLKDGCDVRDLLSGVVPTERVAALQRFLAKLGPCDVPEAQRAVPATAAGEQHKPKLEPLPCSSWKSLVNAWKGAIHWRKDLEDVLAVMMAVAASTDRRGDQLFLQVVGDPGSGKTQFCDGFLVSSHSYALEHLTGFHSGYNDGTGKDYSMLARINHKNLITAEGDVMLKNPNFDVIMSQQRRIFDGTITSSYKNQDEDRQYSGLRTPWTMCVTPAMLDSNQSALGDRFLRIWIEPPSDEEKMNILNHAGYAALRALTQSGSNGKPGGHYDSGMLDAYRMTGGYVDWVRSNVEILVPEIVGASDVEDVISRCATYAQFTAEMRARPADDRFGVKESEATKELPARLTKQLVRTAVCLAVIMNKPKVDKDVLARVKKVAIGTARGRTLNIVHLLAQSPAKGEAVHAVAAKVGIPDTRARELLRFLTAIKVAEYFETKSPGLQTRARWRLTPRFSSIYRKVYNAPR